MFQGSSGSIFSMGSAAAMEWRTYQRWELQKMKRLVPRVFRKNSYLIFSRDCEGAGYPRRAEGEVFHVLTARNLVGSKAIVDALLAVAKGNAPYLEDVRRGKIIGFLILRDGQLVHYSYLLLKNRTLCILGAAWGGALIGNVFTVPEYRGKRCQPRAVDACAALAREAGFVRVIAETSLDNIASQKGMTTGGMTLLGRMDLVVLFSCIVIRWRRPPGFRMLGFCLNAD